jgi:hypothetical protein
MVQVDFLISYSVRYMLENFHMHWASVIFSKKLLTTMRYMMKEKAKLLINMT